MQAHFILSVKNRAASTGSDPRVCVGLRIDWSWNRFRMGRWKDQALNWVHITKKYSSLQQVIRYGVVANIAVSHTAAGGSIPPIGAHLFVFFFLAVASSSTLYSGFTIWLLSHTTSDMV